MLIPEKIPGLIPGKIAVWLLDIDQTPSEINEFEAILSSEEKTRAKRFKFLNDRHRYIIQHGMLRLLLSGYMKRDPQHIEIRTSPNGKPYVTIQNGDSIHFSVSRSDEFVVFAFSCKGRIGIDIEKISDMPDMIEIVERHFTHNEKKEIILCPEKLRLKLFYKLWTRKEAVLKAQGEGLLKALECVDVATNKIANGPWKVQVAGDSLAEEFWLIDVLGPGGYSTALAVSATNLHEKFSVSVNYL